MGARLGPHVGAALDDLGGLLRGEANLVCLTDETPLTIRWNQGLLVTSQHLLETGGSATEPQYYDQIVLDLDNVTAYCREGLYYLRRGPGKAYQFHVNAYADQCIFAADAGNALFEMIGPTTPPELLLEVALVPPAGLIEAGRASRAPYTIRWDELEMR